VGRFDVMVMERDNVNSNVGRFDGMERPPVHTAVSDDARKPRQSQTKRAIECGAGGGTRTRTCFHGRF
jgi:hypothetical protein